MSLLTVREQFVRLSGRHDLVTDFSGNNFTNNSGNIGADFFLDSGQRMLDRKFGGIKRYGWYKKDISAGDHTIEFQQGASIKEVWCMNATVDRYPLQKKDLNWMREYYGEAYADLTEGEPQHYAELVMNLAPEQKALTSSNYTGTFTYDAEEIFFSDEGDHYDYKGILFLPPADETFTMSILARFRSQALSANVSTFWTEVHPDILILAGMWSLERFYRNTTGMNDFMGSIVDAAADLEKDQIETEVQDLDQMWG